MAIDIFGAIVVKGTVHQGRGRNAQLPAATPFESLSTCLALIEIVDSCNLACPTCYANSPVGIGSEVKAHPLDSIKQRILGVLDRKGGMEILQPRA